MRSYRFTGLALGAAFAFVLLWAPAVSLRAQQAGAYTAAQAAQGASLFAAHCAQCHGQNLEGQAGPQLAGSDFMASWSGKTADDLYYVMSTQMPLDAPGSLQPNEYLAILAFVLQKNGLPAGDAPLQQANLKAITIKQ